MSEILLDVQQLHFAYGDRVLFHDLSFQVRRGECWVILGANGAGKTTLLSCLAGFLSEYEGKILLGDQDIAYMSLLARARCRAFFSSPPLDTFGLSVFDAVQAGRHPHLSSWQWESEEDETQTREALALFHLEALSRRDIRTLSAGERQRVALAALLTQQPSLYLLDEPAAHLDPAQQISALDTVYAYAKKHHAALVMVMHEMHLATRYADHVILLDSEETTQGSAALLNETALSKLFHTPMIALENDGVKTFAPSRSQPPDTTLPPRR
jgi:ABC-type cobalamin/Fe3+-siderophores transport systems, ATPase components